MGLDAIYQRGSSTHVGFLCYCGPSSDWAGLIMRSMAVFLFSVLLALWFLPVLNVHAQTGTPPPLPYCPPTVTPTSVIPTFVFPTFAGFATSVWPTLTHTPCPPGAPCPTVTSLPTNTATITPSPTVTPTNTAPPGALKLTAFDPSAYGGQGTYTLTQYKSALVNGAAWNTFYGSAIMTGSTAYEGKQLNFSMSVQNVSSGSVMVYIKARRSGIPGQGAVNWRYPPLGTFPSMGQWRYGSESVDDLSYSLGPGGTITLKPAVEADTGWLSWSSHTLTSYVAISTQPLDSIYTPTPAVTPTATLMIPGTTCQFGNPNEGSVSGGGTAFTPPVLVPGSCFTIVPDLELEVPSIVDWTVSSVPSTIGIPGIEVCTQYWSMNLSFMGFNVINAISVVVGFACVAIIYRTFQN